MSWEDHWKEFFDEENVNLLDSIITCIDDSGQDIMPMRDEVLRMFTLMKPVDIRVVIVGQSPYPNSDACGIPFVSAKGNVTASLGNMKKEISMEFGKPYIKDPNSMVENWTKQGVFMINASLTIGLSGEEYLRDHSVVWREFIIKLLEYIGKENIPFLLFGKDAWGFEENIRSGCILKVPHPVSRGDKKFLGCMVFTNANKFLRSIGSREITWFS